MSSTAALRRLAVAAARGAVVLALVAGPALAADDPTPAGRWKQFDDRKGDLRSLIRIEIADGEMSGTIEKVFLRVGEAENPTCDKCPGDFKDEPIVGLRFVWGLKGQGRSWDGGRILDPEDGKIYRVKVTLSEDGRTLEVRGYVGLSLFGRTQRWVRDQQ